MSDHKSNKKASAFLDDILAMLYSFKEDADKLEKLHEYIKNELYEDPGSYQIKVLKKYQSLVTEVAESLDAGLVCYINPDTLEKVEIPKSILEGGLYDFDEEEEGGEEDEDMKDDLFYQDMKHIHKDWEKCLTIEPPESNIAFGYMEEFVNHLPEGRLKTALFNALSRQKPFGNFNAIIHQSDAREDWFAFKQKNMEQYVAEKLMGKLPLGQT